MKYLVRAVKYYFYLLVILVILMSVLVLAKVVDADLSTMFVNGLDSLWQIALLMLVFAAVYPKIGYARRDALVPGSDEDVLPILDRVMENHQYIKVETRDDSIIYRKRAIGDRIVKIWEDKVTVARTATGFELEGINRDVVRLCSALRDARGDWQSGTNL